MLLNICGVELLTENLIVEKTSKLIILYYITNIHAFFRI
jgi:hypothetical protein